MALRLGDFEVVFVVVFLGARMDLDVSVLVGVNHRLKLTFECLKFAFSGSFKFTKVSILGMNQAWKAVLVYTVALTLIIQALSVLAGPTPPAANTIQQGRGVNMPSADFWDYFYRGHNITAFFEAIATWLVNHTLPTPVWEPTVEWGLVYGATGDWFNHTLPGEPVYIGLQMHPDNITYDGVLVLPVVYDKDATHWQLAIYWVNGTQVTDNTPFMVMYHMRWEPGLANPNEPQLPLQGPPT